MLPANANGQVTRSNNFLLPAGPCFACGLPTCHFIDLPPNLFSSAFLTKNWGTLLHTIFSGKKCGYFFVEVISLLLTMKSFFFKKFLPNNTHWQARPPHSTLSRAVVRPDDVLGFSKEQLIGGVTRFHICLDIGGLMMSFFPLIFLTRFFKVNTEGAERLHLNRFTTDS
jgi:hypothetical protein